MNKHVRVSLYYVGEVKQKEPQVGFSIRGYHNKKSLLYTIDIYIT